MLATFVGVLTLSQVTSSKPPKVATLAGFTLGKTTIRQFERRHGQGWVHVGGHPRGARTWYDKTTGAQIDVDGFNFSDDGEVVDGIRIDWPTKDRIEKQIPKIRLKRSELGLLKTLHRGSSRKDVEMAVGGKLKSNEFRATGLIKYREALVNKDKSNAYKTWDATFLFRHDGLIEISVMAD